MSRIPISKKHGFNPTIPRCFWCGEEKREIALLGRLPGDKEAPMSCVIDYDPCDKCQEMWKRGIAVLRCVTHPPQQNMPPFQGDIRKGNALWVDSRHVVITRDAFQRIFGEMSKELLDATLQKGVCLLEDKIFDTLFMQVPEPVDESSPTEDSKADDIENNQEGDTKS